MQKQQLIIAFKIKKWMNIGVYKEEPHNHSKYSLEDIT